MSNSGKTRAATPDVEVRASYQRKAVVSNLKAEQERRKLADKARRDAHRRAGRCPCSREREDAEFGTCRKCREDARVRWTKSNIVASEAEPAAPIPIRNRRDFLRFIRLRWADIRNVRNFGKFLEARVEQGASKVWLDEVLTRWRADAPVLAFERWINEESGLDCRLEQGGDYTLERVLGQKRGRPSGN